MTERPILFSGPMVRAILEGRKTQTRRMIKPIPDKNAIYSGGWRWGKCKSFACGIDVAHEHSPYGVPGDRLWVRESHKFENDKGDCIFYKADGARHYVQDNGEWLRPEDMWKWRPSIHMPRWASRIILEVASVRVERLQSISDEEAKAEGIVQTRGGTGDPRTGLRSSYGVSGEVNPWAPTPRLAYETLWESINGPGSWDANPWVWVVEFKVIKP